MTPNNATRGMGCGDSRSNDAGGTKGVRPPSRAGLRPVARGARDVHDGAREDAPPTADR